MIFELTLQELWEIILDIWATGNRWARIALAIIIGWPILLLVYALGNPPIWSGSLMALIPVIALFILIMTRLDPMVLAVVMAFKKGRTVLSYISTIVGIELAIGVYCTLVRIGNDPELAMLLILFLITYIFLAMGVKGNKFVGFAKSVCIVGIIILTAIFILGGREEIREKAEANYHPPGHPAPYPQDYAKKETRRFEYPEPGGGIAVKLETNCDKEDFIATIPPRHKIELHHVYFAETLKANRCSYNVYGDSYPVFGPGELFQTKREFKGDLPAPQFHAHTSLIKFLHPDMRTVYQAVERNGDVISTENCSDGEIRVYSIYNLSKGILFSGLAQQIGHDGSTVTFEGVITPAECPG